MIHLPPKPSPSASSSIEACPLAESRLFLFARSVRFSSAVFLKPFIFLVCSALMSCLPTCTLPCTLPSSSRVTFFLLVTLKMAGCLIAVLYRLSDAILVRRMDRSSDGPISVSSIRGVRWPLFFSCMRYERTRMVRSSVSVKLSTCSMPCRRIDSI
uniref:Uncharacterized protein n=1 Tax=Anopheles melas TaxID=34690 RepID=A0A182TW86_9DIPT